MTDEARNEARERKATRIADNASLVIFAVIGVPLLIFVIYANLIAPALNDDPQWVGCGRVSAVAVDTYKGFTRIDVSTEECGVVEYSEGVNRSSAEQIAARIRPGMEIEFLMGKLTRQELEETTVAAPGPSEFREAGRD